MRSLYVQHHVCVTARPWWKCKSRGHGQRNPRRLGFEIQANLHNRRAALLSVAASVLAAPACAFTSTSPYEDAKTMQYGLDNERSATYFGNHSSALSAINITGNSNVRSEGGVVRQTYTYLSWGGQP